MGLSIFHLPFPLCSEFFVGAGTAQTLALMKTHSLSTVVIRWRSVLPGCLITLGIFSECPRNVHPNGSNAVNSGHTFSVVKGASGIVNYVDPPRRDVSPTGARGLTIRFTADNPGCVFQEVSWILAECPVSDLGSYIAILTFTWKLALPSFLLKLQLRSLQDQTPLILGMIGMVSALFTRRCRRIFNNLDIIY